MPELRLELLIHAKPETCFALLRDPRLHTETKAFVEGELGLGQRVRFESEMLGIKQVLLVEVTEFELGRLVTDTMVTGTFREFCHVHEFIPRRGGRSCATSSSGVRRSARSVRRRTLFLSKQG